jgi:hypothetical protein
MRALAVAVLGTVALASAARTACPAPLFVPTCRAELARDPSDLLAAGSFGSPFSNEITIQLTAYPDLDGATNQYLVGYRYYAEEVYDEDWPYRLQPFLQEATYAEVVLESGPKEAGLFAVGGRYMFPGAPFGAAGTVGLGKMDTGGDRRFANVGFDFYIIDELAVEARMEFGECGGGYNRFQGGVRFLAEVVRTGHVMEFYLGYRSLSAEGDEDPSGVVFEGRYFFDKHLFAGLEFTTDTNRFGVAAGYNTGSGFLAEIEAGSDDKGEGLEDVERRGQFVRIMVGLQF